MKTIPFLIGLMSLFLFPLPAGATDCADNFPAGRFGLSQEDPAFNSGKLVRDGFTPIFLRKGSVPLEPEKGFTDCKFVNTSNIFRLAYEKESNLLLAGCSGDFDGDGRSDYALLMQGGSKQSVESVVFLNRKDHYRAVSLGVPSDHYGFDENRSIWPGPFCLEKPGSSRFFGFDDPVGVQVFGDLITVGWQTHYWNPKKKTFDALWTSD